MDRSNRCLLGRMIKLSYHLDIGNAFELLGSFLANIREVEPRMVDLDVYEALKTGSIHPAMMYAVLQYDIFQSLDIRELYNALPDDRISQGRYRASTTTFYPQSAYSRLALAFLSCQNLCPRPVECHASVAV